MSKPDSLMLHLPAWARWRSGAVVSDRTPGRLAGRRARRLGAGIRSEPSGEPSGELILALHVQPGARRSAILGEHGARLKLALQAPPVDGKANEELLRFLGASLGLRRRDVRLLAGATSRNKSVALAADLESARRCLDLLTAALGARGSPGVSAGQQE